MAQRARLRTKDINKLSGILNISATTLEEMASIGMLNAKGVRDLLIYHDWFRLRKNSKYTPANIYSVLSREDGVTKNTLSIIINSREVKTYTCHCCNKKISKHIHDKYDGLCKQCAVDNLQI